MLIVNRYVSPITQKTSIQAHVINNGKITKSYNKMDGEDLGLFVDYKLILICEVVKSSSLKNINLINKDIK